MAMKYPISMKKVQCYNDMHFKRIQSVCLFHDQQDIVYPAVGGSCYHWSL